MMKKRMVLFNENAPENSMNKKKTKVQEKLNRTLKSSKGFLTAVKDTYIVASFADWMPQ